MISDGGCSFLRLADRRLAFVANRHVHGLHGGGTPVTACSGDSGRTWSAAKTLVDGDAAFDVMNDRLIQLKSGRLLLPVSWKLGAHEGDQDESLAMLSDDEGDSWRLSHRRLRLDKPGGMQEPCAIELADGRVRLLSRTGAGFIHSSISADGGETWSVPGPTTLESPCSSLTLRRGPSGRLFCRYNHAKPLGAAAFFPRTPLVYALSADDGETGSAPVVTALREPNAATARTSTPPSASRPRAFSWSGRPMQSIRRVPSRAGPSHGGSAAGSGRSTPCRRAAGRGRAGGKGGLAADGFGHRGRPSAPVPRRPGRRAETGDCFPARGGDKIAGGGPLGVLVPSLNVTGDDHEASSLQRFNACGRGSGAAVWLEFRRRIRDGWRHEPGSAEHDDVRAFGHRLGPDHER